jgi:cyclohexyl-isocyanide hydratase
VDGKHISAAGVTAGIDGALRLASILRNERTAKVIQLSMEYAPEPPFNCGSPQSAPPDVLEAALAATRKITEARLATAQRIAARFGIEPV